jgi:hypothetical protein
LQIKFTFKKIQCNLQKMTATAHALVGAVIAAKVANPFLAYPAALGSHFLMDLIPHWDAGTGWEKKKKTKLFLEAALDVLVGIFLVFLIFGGHVSPPHLWLTVFFAQMPDWLDAPYLFFKLKVFPMLQVYKIQSVLHSKANFAYGLATQVVLVIPLVLFTLPQPIEQVVTSAFAFLR